LARVATELGLPAPDPDWIGLATAFLAPGADRTAMRSAVETACRAEAIDVVAWRDVPVDPGVLGDRARESMPQIVQALLLRPPGLSKEESERACHRARRRAEAAVRKGFGELIPSSPAGPAERAVYFPSFSFYTVTYKGLVAADQLGEFYADLREPDLEAHFAIFHQRYSTNTLPTWERAQPFRLICHNGEINTIAGNVNRMRSREGRLGKWSLLEEEVLRPVIDESGSDSAMLDNVLEMLAREGQYPDDCRDIRHAVAMLVPAAWEGTPGMPDEVSDFYRWHASIMEPWDGPAGLVFTDGVRVGAALDRNGLRPLRTHVCEDGFVAASSEAGAVDVSGHGRVRRGKLGPGQMIFVDPADGGFQEDPVARIATRRPYGGWLAEYRIRQTAGEPDVEVPPDLARRQVAHGYTREEMNLILRPAATNGKEPTFSMGDDTAAAVLSSHRRTLYNYFKQRFAQVTNPAIDHLRERFVMSLRTLIGPHDPLLWERPEACAHLEYDTFLLFRPPGGVFVDATFDPEEGPGALRRAVERIAEAAVRAAATGSGIIVVSDAHTGPERAPVPSLLAVGAVNTALLRAGHRTRT
ncbi:MAG: glutamate synthase central domain-containing protein, partial [Actinomycetota bacterium]